ncbi:MAG: hypothetical protein ACYC34_12720, partial [Desulfobacteria bacterium]
MRRSFRPSQNGAISEDSFRKNIENIQDYSRPGRLERIVDREGVVEPRGISPSGMVAFTFASAST